MMAKQPAERFQSMSAVGDVLSEWLRSGNADECAVETVVGVSPLPLTTSETRPSVFAFEGGFPKMVDQRARTIASQPARPPQAVNSKPGARTWWILGVLGILVVVGTAILLMPNANALRIEVSNDAVGVVIDGQAVPLTNLHAEIALSEGSHQFAVTVAGVDVPVGPAFLLQTDEHNGDFRIIARCNDNVLTEGRFTCVEDSAALLTVELVRVEEEVVVPGDQPLVVSAPPADESGEQVLPETTISPTAPAPVSTPSGSEEVDGEDVSATADIAPMSPQRLVSPFSAETAQQLQAEWAAYLGREIVEEISIGMQFAVIPPGEFTMGLSDRERAEIMRNWPEVPVGGIADEEPPHQVRLCKAVDQRRSFCGDADGAHAARRFRHDAEALRCKSFRAGVGTGGPYAPAN